MNNLVVGMGEIGQAVAALIGDCQTIDIEAKPVVPGIDVMHVCFPFSSHFVQDLQQYIKVYEPKHVIIYSTLPIATCDKVGFDVVHSPVEGKHPDLALSMRVMERWIASRSKDELNFFFTFFNDLGLNVKKITNPCFTEALKLLSTTEYGLNIAFAEYKKQIAEAIDMPYELTKEWNREYNRLYKELGMDKRFQKFVLDAPEGPIGGHCVVPNTLLLETEFPHFILKLIQGVGK